MWLWSTSAPELLFDHASQVVLARMREIQEADDGESVDLKSINIYTILYFFLFYYVFRLVFNCFIQFVIHII